MVGATEAISKGTLVDALVERIKADVFSHRYPAGTLLPPERELATKYGVTRTSLKHALMRLSQAHLVETRHGIGTYVLDYQRSAGPDLLPMLLAQVLTGSSEVDGGWLFEMFEVRREVGSLVAERAATYRNAEHCESLRQCLSAVATSESATHTQLAETEVHRLLAAACGNRVYGLLVNSLLSAYLHVGEQYLEPFKDSALAARRLSPLIEAVCAGDAKAARRQAERYLIKTERLMLGPER